MDYPNNFNIPAFPAGKTIAVTRSVSVWISIVFFLIVAACGFILLGTHLKTNYPFLISVDPFTNDWSVIAYPTEQNKKIPQYQIIQEKFVHDFVTDWFTISKDATFNDARWKQCSIAECGNTEQFNPRNMDCAISCKSNETISQEFVNKVLPQYLAMIEQASETWTVGPMLITPTAISENKSLWQVYMDVHSRVMGTFNVLVFIEIQRDVNMYPATFGYYVTQFNSYRIEQNE